jgi:hypothetical protein
MLRRSVRAGLALGVLSAGLVASAARAQASFEWPSDTTIDVARYLAPEECLAATERLEGAVKNTYAERLRDTLPETPIRMLEEARSPLPEPAAEAARRCSARFPVAAAPLGEFAPLLALYLAAGRDADADALVERRLKMVAVTAELERAAVLDTAASIYLGIAALTPSRSLSLPLFTHPGRLAAAERLVTALAQMKSASWQTRLTAFTALAIGAWEAGDTTRAHRMGEAAIALSSTLTPAERRTEDFQLLRTVLDRTVITLNEAALQDSLRQSTAAYAAFYRALWAQVAGLGGTPGRPIGEPAPRIEAEFWFRRDDSTASRPVKGKVNLVVFLDQRVCFGAGASTACLATCARLRRLARQFPALEITLVAQTRGWFHLGVPPTPVGEAALLQRAWLEEQKLPGALAVATTDFWRLPDPDRRRIDRDVASVTRYTFGRTWSVPGASSSLQLQQFSSSFLVDQNGIVVDAYNDIDERQMPELISILLARPVASRP